MAEVFSILAAGGLVALLFLIVRAVRAEARKQPSEFAAGIARSLKSDPSSWDYNSAECWLISQKAALEISLQDGNFGRVNTRNCINSGSSHIVTFQSADRRAFRDALDRWRELTAIERTQTAERRKREALAALAEEA
jgi:hypothetical protein